MTEDRKKQLVEDALHETAKKFCITSGEYADLMHKGILPRRLVSTWPQLKWHTQPKPLRLVKPDYLEVVEGPHLDAPLKLIGASGRLYGALVNDCVNTLREAAAIPIKEQLRRPNFGRRALDELQSLLLGKLPLLGSTTSDRVALARYMQADDLRREGGLTYREIGEEMRCSTWTAKRLCVFGERERKKAEERSKYRLVSVA